MYVVAATGNRAADAIRRSADERRLEYWSNVGATGHARHHSRAINNCTRDADPDRPSSDGDGDGEANPDECANNGVRRHLGYRPAD